jgi:putative hydrolase of the HAD superfamily
VHALGTAKVEPGRAVMVGDRLDYDVRPAKAAGMRTVWVLRGEAPDDPTTAQLAETDASVRDLTELPGAIAVLASR